MKKLLINLKSLINKVATGILIGWFIFAVSFNILATILYAFFPEAWSKVAHHMSQL